MVNTASPAFRSMFREYDLRGRVSDEELNHGSVELIAGAFGQLLREQSVDAVVVGYDNRPASPGFKDAAVAGLRAAGCNVTDIGLTITPALYFAQHQLQIAGGMMITASHNPSEWLGMKLADGLSRTLGPNHLRQLYALVEARAQQQPAQKGSTSGSYRTYDIRDEYLDRIAGETKLTRPLRVVVDCGNGGAGVFAYELLQRIGAMTFQLNCDPDDSYPHYFPNPSDLAARQRLRAMVTHQYIHADVGLAFDGDGDRIGVQDETGADVWSDRVLILLARRMLEQHPGSTIVYDVKCTRGVAEEVQAGGGTPVMWKTGHSHIKAKMHELNAELAGERSGHIFYGADYYGFDDALYAAVQLLQLLAAIGQSLSELLATTPQYITSPEITAPCADDAKYGVVDSITALLKSRYGDAVIDINGARLTFEDSWGLVRASSNLPELVLIFEASTEHRLREIYQLFRSVLAEQPLVGTVWHNDLYAAR